MSSRARPRRGFSLCFPSLSTGPSVSHFQNILIDKGRRVLYVQVLCVLHSPHVGGLSQASVLSPSFQADSGANEGSLLSFRTDEERERTAVTLPN